MNHSIIAEQRVFPMFKSCHCSSEG